MAALVVTSFLGCGDDPPAREGPDLAAFDPAVAALVEPLLAATVAAPEDAAAHGRLGLAFYANHLLPRARTSFATAARLAPDAIEWRYHLALTDARIDPAQAVDDLARLSQDAPDLAAAHHHLGYALLDAGDLAAAEAAFRRVIELEPRYAAGFAGLGETLLRAGELVEARAALEAGLARNESEKSLQYLIGQIYLKLGETARAEPYLQSGVGGQRPVLPDPWYLERARLVVSLGDRIEKGVSLLDAGRPAEAASVFELVLRDHPDSTHARDYLARCHLRLRRPDRACATLEPALAGAPSLRILIRLAECRLAMRRPDETLAVADRALALDPESARALYWRARALTVLGRLDEASAALALALRRDPKNGAWHVEAARVAYRRGAPEVAAEHFRAALRVAPDAASWAHLGLARIALEAGELEEAATELRAARSLVPEHPQIARLTLELAEARGADGAATGAP